MKVLILANKDRQSENDPSHILYFVDGEQRRQGAGERPQERSDGQRGVGNTPDASDAISGAPQRLPWA